MPIRSMIFRANEVASDLDGSPTVSMKGLGIGYFRTRKTKGKAICFVKSLPNRYREAPKT